MARVSQPGTFSSSVKVRVISERAKAGEGIRSFAETCSIGVVEVAGVRGLAEIRSSSFDAQQFFFKLMNFWIPFPKVNFSTTTYSHPVHANQTL
ncbi:unnamed protein product [Bubo scandiacus]